MRNTRKTTAKRARDRRARAAELAQDRRKLRASASKLCCTFGAAKAPLRRENRAISGILFFERGKNAENMVK